MKDIDKSQSSVFLSNGYVMIPNVHALPKVGAGHDGVVYQYGDFVFKILKYDIERRKVKDLMTFEKATYFANELKLKRITQPIDILLNSDGIYTGYVMKYLHDISKYPEDDNYRSIKDFTLGELEKSVDELEEDVGELTRKRIVIDDLNRGSYIITSNFLNMCDMDKFKIVGGPNAIYDINKNKLNFFISKAMYYEMEKSGLFTKDELKQLMRWVKKSSNSRDFLRQLRRDCQNDESYPFGEYVMEKGKIIVR